MSLGLINVPTTCISLINNILKSFVDSFLIVFIVDILVYSKIKEEHASHLCFILGILKEKQLYAIFSKCEF